MAAARYGPNVIITNEELEKRKDALRKVSDDQLRKCKQLLLEGGKSLTTLVMGETGTGKSTLINALLGKKIANVASGPAETTTNLKCYTGCVGKVDVTVMEIHNLDMDQVRVHTSKLEKNSLNGVDVVYICQKLYDRHRPSTIETLRRLSVVFGREIYKKAVFVMTFANEIPKSWGRKTDAKTLQRNLEKDWNNQAAVIRSGLQKELHMTQEEADKVLILPAGYYEKDDPDSSRQILGLTSDWIYDLMLASVNTNISGSNNESSKFSQFRRSKTVAAPAFLKVMASQVGEDSILGGYNSSSEYDGLGGYSSGGGLGGYSSGGGLGGYSSGGGLGGYSSGGGLGGYSSSGGLGVYSSSGGLGGYSSGGGLGGYSSGGGLGGYSSDDCKFSGYVSEFLEVVGKCLLGLELNLFTKILTMVQEVASSLFSCIVGIGEAVGKVFQAIYKSETALVTMEVVVSAVADLVIGVVSAVVSAVVLAMLVITILAMILTLLGAIVLGLLVICGAVVGAVYGGMVGGIVGSIFPGPGSVIGAGIGATVGGYLGGASVLSELFRRH